MTKRPLAELTAKQTPLQNLSFEDEQLGGEATIENMQVTNCRLHKVGLRYATIKSSSFKHCEFSQVNLRDAKLQQVDFTGARLINCNLAHTQFSGCRFWYTEFEGCRINYAGLIPNLPVEHNLRQAVLRSLRCNATAEGDTRSSNQLLLLELKAEQDELFGRFWHPSDYYKKYSGFDRAKAFGAWLSHRFQGAFWGHGVRLKNLALSIIVIWIAVAAAAVWLRADYHITGEEHARALTWFEAIYLTVITFCTVGYGDIVPADNTARTLAMLTSTIGVISLGFVVSGVYRRLAR